MLVESNPHLLPENSIALLEPSDFQTKLIDKEKLAANPAALAFAYSLDVLQSAGIEPDPGLVIDSSRLEYFPRTYGDGAVLEIVSKPDTDGSGIVVDREIELKVVSKGNGDRKCIRYEVNSDGTPKIMNMEPMGIELALASRAAEYIAMHNDEMHEHILKIKSGEIPHVLRTNTRSLGLENAMGMVVETEINPADETETHTIKQPATKVIATTELAYKRQSVRDKERRLSREEAGLKGTFILGPDGVVSSLYALGGMPPVTGSVDTVTTAAMSYMRSWIPRNGVFAGNFERQLGMFQEVKGKIESYGLPPEIEDNVIDQVGIAVGCDDPARIAEQVIRFQAEGGHAVRIYTTNPDPRVLETAMEINKAVREIDPDFLICVGPVVDAPQAQDLHDLASVRMFLAGHGGGENCSSLDGGGAANSLEILYEMYLDKRFNDSLIGLEGGTGTSIGAILPLLDVISMNKRGVGGIESTGGLYLVKEGMPVLPYNGSASPVTKRIEYYASGSKKILGLDGRVKNDEGKPGSLQMRDSARSNARRYAEARERTGRVLADQQSMSIYELRKRIARFGHNHVFPSNNSYQIAEPHRAAIH